MVRGLMMPDGFGMIGRGVKPRREERKPWNPDEEKSRK
jgi:hypothetical protein